MPVPWEEVMVVFSPAERAEIERAAAEIVAQNRPCARCARAWA